MFLPLLKLVPVSCSTNISLLCLTTNQCIDLPEPTTPAVHTCSHCCPGCLKVFMTPLMFMKGGTATMPPMHVVCVHFCTAAGGRAAAGGSASAVAHECLPVCTCMMSPQGKGSGQLGSCPCPSIAQHCTRITAPRAVHLPLLLWDVQWTKRLQAVVSGPEQRGWK